MFHSLVRLIAAALFKRVHHSRFALLKVYLYRLTKVQCNCEVAKVFH